jgi:alpha-tubulin suppressor-like RCC1 family protein
VAAGTISSDARLTITGPAGAAIRYTLDGSTPSASNGSAYAAPIPIDRSMTVKAYCSQAGFVDSPMAIAAYTVKLPPVVFSIPGGDYYGPQTLRLSCAVSGSEISYQINGGVSQAYSGPISLTAASTNVQAYATKANCTPQDSYSSAIYSIKTPPPVVDLRSGTFRAEQDVRVSPRRAGLSVIYTLDGSSPAAANSTTATTITEAATVHIEKTRTFRAISRSAVSGDSEELSFTYELKVPEPRASLPPGSYPPSETLSLSDAVDGATIKYSLDAATVPSATTGTQYSAALPLYKAQSIKAMAYKAGWTPSDLVSFDYAFRGDIVDVAAGSTFVLYLRRDGSLWYRGKLGESSSNYRASKLADGVARFWASESFCLWVTKDGQLYGQGDNTYGQLGQGRTGYVYQGSQILGDVVDVALGVQYAMAVKKDGSLWAWGYNWGYRMGIPGATSSDTVLSPRLIMASGAKAVAAGHDHSLVLKSDGSLWGCGYNGSSQLTSSFPSNQRTHVQLVAANVAAVYAGPDQSYYLEKVADGFDLHAVGGNGSYMIGNYSSGNVNYFTILGLELASMPKSFSAAKSENLALLVTGEGKLYGWGSSNAGAFGLGDWNTHQSPTPLREGVVAAAAGNNCSLYVSAEGALWGMGRNSNYELGDASNEGYGVKYGSNANVPALIAW